MKSCCLGILIYCFYGIKFSVIMYEFTLVKVRQTVVLAKNSLKVAMSVSFCLPNPVAVSAFIICSGLY